MDPSARSCCQPQHVSALLRCQRQGQGQAHWQVPRTGSPYCDLGGWGSHRSREAKDCQSAQGVILGIDLKTHGDKCRFWNHSNIFQSFPDAASANSMRPWLKATVCGGLQNQFVFQGQTIHLRVRIIWYKLVGTQMICLVPRWLAGKVVGMQA